MKKAFKLTILSLSLLVSVSSCRENEKDAGVVTEENIVSNAKAIDGLIRAKSKMKSLSFHRDSSTNKSAVDIEIVREKYRSNLDLINKETGLNLIYNDNEFQAMLASLEGNYINNGFTISNEKYNENLIKIRKSNSEQMYNETNDILKKVYNINQLNSKTGKSITRGCALALAGNFVATIGLGACATGVGCPIAIAGKVLAMASVADSCLF